MRPCVGVCFWVFSLKMPILLQYLQTLRCDLYEQFQQYAQVNKQWHCASQHSTVAAKMVWWRCHQAACTPNLVIAKNQSNESRPVDCFLAEVLRGL